MAGLLNRNGRYILRFVNEGGERRTLSLQTRSERLALSIKLKIENLLAARGSSQPADPETVAWVADLKPPFRKRLEKVGLLDLRETEQPTVLTLGEHLTNYFAKRTDVKPSTVIHWRHAKRSLISYFGADRPLTSITSGEARDWERWLKTGQARENRYAHRTESEGLAPNTVHKRVGDAKQFFQDAVDRDLMTKNPFAGLNCTVGGNRERDHFVTRADAEKLLAACPDVEWRLIFALSRYGGLRCPSEHLAFTWGDVNWEQERFTVHSPKTEHHEGKGERVVPLFPELRPYLEAAFDSAEEGAVHVVTRYRDANANLRTQLLRIIRRANLKPWPKLFQNLRASRATELASEHPAHVAAAWLGHSTVVANKHYWQVTEADFAKAARSASAPARPRRGSQVAEAAKGDSQEPAETREVAHVVEAGMGGTGLEPVTSTV